MKKVVVIFIVFAIVLLLCACGGNLDSSGLVSEKDESTGAIANFNVGASLNAGMISIETLQAGFSEVYSCGYTITKSHTSTSNGKSSLHAEYYMLECNVMEGKLAFVVLCNITNLSDKSINIEEQLVGSAIFDGLGTNHALVYAFQHLSSAKYNTIRAGASTPACIVCVVNDDYCDSFDGCTVEIFGTTLRYEKDDILWRSSIVFPTPHDLNVLYNVGDPHVTETDYIHTAYALPDSNGLIMIDGLPADNIGVKSDLTLDEVAVTDCHTQDFRLWVKLHNTSEESFPVVIVNYQLCDESGKTIYNGYLVYDGINSGESSWSNILVTGISFDAVSDVRLVSYTVADYDNSEEDISDEEQRISIKEQYDFYVEKYKADFTNSCIITKDQITAK